ncbi:unnamed protein product [Durusdinium trenchii]|uniref:FHA domain-containing protein n=1 Tax=Durusdinium trenchii TaxID=1381693 RepID=A0ABP0M2Q1_9DINO
MARERSRSRSEYTYSSYSSDARPGANAASGGKVLEKAVTDRKANGGKAKVEEASIARRDANPGGSELQQEEAKVALDNLKEMLAERQRELAEEANLDRQKDIKKDIEILKQWLREKEGKLEASAEAGQVKEEPKSDISGKEHAASKGEEKRATKESKQATSHKMSENKGSKKKEAAEVAKKEAAGSASKAEKVPKKASSKEEAKQKSKSEKDPKKRPKEENGLEAPPVPPAAVSKKEKSSREDPSKEKKPEKKDAAETGSKEAPQDKQVLDKAKEQPSKDKLLQSAELIEQAKEALRHLRQKASSQAEAAEPEEAQDQTGAEADADPAAADKVTVLMPSAKVPPCELPLWCVMPNSRDVETVFEIARHVNGSVGPPKRLQLGRRSWALLGRRLHEAQAAEARRAGVPEPDIGLACPLSSKAHALVLQNWIGKIFLQDLGSAHGTFMGGVRLKPHEPVEWMPGVQVYFADAQLEFFELRAS